MKKIAHLLVLSVAMVCFFGGTQEGRADDGGGGFTTPSVSEDAESPVDRRIDILKRTVIGGDTVGRVVKVAHYLDPSSGGVWLATLFQNQGSVRVLSPLGRERTIRFSDLGDGYSPVQDGAFRAVNIEEVNGRIYLYLTSYKGSVFRERLSGW